MSRKTKEDIEKLGPVIRAIRMRDPKALQSALEEGGDPNERDAKGKSALFHVLKPLKWYPYRLLEILCILLESGADIHEKLSDGSSALIYAIRNCPTQVTRDESSTYFKLVQSFPEKVRYLLDHGADPNGADNKGFTPMMVAARHNSKSLELLAEAGADLTARLEMKHWGDMDALMMAAYYGSYGWYFRASDVVKFLMEHGLDINRQSSKGYTALCLSALKKDRPGDIYDLLELGADPTLRTQEGYTALDIAQHKHHWRSAAVIKWVLSQGIKKGQKRPAPWPFHWRTTYL